MSDDHAKQMRNDLRAVLAQLHKERDRFPDAPLSAAGVLLGPDKVRGTTVPGLREDRLAPQKNIGRH
jgi:hypothetical protein